MASVSETDFTLSITSVARPKELEATLQLVMAFPNVQVILNGANLEDYQAVVDRYRDRVRFIVNERNRGIAAAWNQGVITADTRYVILSGDDLVFTEDWFDPLLDRMRRAHPPLQVSLSDPMSFSCFCMDKSLVALQGWFDHNFTRAYHEDEDWYLRFRERLGLHHDPVPYDEIIPRLKTVRRPEHKRAPWNAIPNKVYFSWKWRRMPGFAPQCLHSRGLRPYQRRLPEPTWERMGPIREAYAAGKFGQQEWRYSPPRWEMRALTTATDNRVSISLRKAIAGFKS